MDFRKEIKKLMKKKKINTAQLAWKAHLNYGTVYYFLKGKGDKKAKNKGNITLRNLNKILKVLNAM